MPPKRAGRVARPGTRRLVLVGELRGVDPHSRYELALAPSRGPVRDQSLQRLLDEAAPGEIAPVEVRPGTPPLVRICLPQHRRAYWLGAAAGMLQRRVRAEATVRHFSYKSPEGVQFHGYSLDLAMCELTDQEIEYVDTTPIPEWNATTPLCSQCRSDFGTPEASAT